MPKVIDFGVAKATNQQLTEKTLFTQVGQIVGTWEYMSPEQAVLNQLDVDTRTDIYSLGVILYELLTGVTPLETRRLRSAAFEELLRIIREEEPPKPSTRISSLGDAVATAAFRGTDVGIAGQDRSWRPGLDRDEGPEKNRSRRYETANSLAADLNDTSAARRSRHGRRRQSTGYIERLLAIVSLSSAMAGILLAMVLGTIVKWRVWRFFGTGKKHRRMMMPAGRRNERGRMPCSNATSPTTPKANWLSW